METEEQKGNEEECAVRIRVEIEGQVCDEELEFIRKTLTANLENYKKGKCKLEIIGPWMAAAPLPSLCLVSEVAPF